MLRRSNCVTAEQIQLNTYAISVVDLAAAMRAVRIGWPNRLGAGNSEN